MFVQDLDQSRSRRSRRRIELRIRRRLHQNYVDPWGSGCATLLNWVNVRQKNLWLANIIDKYMVEEFS
jgi:hypothetical protein